MAKFREHTLKSGIKILLGKDSKSNDGLMEKYEGKNELVLHTVKPGSPFCVICEKPENVNKEDIKEAAIICASKSQDWRDNKKSIKLHLFKANEAYKSKKAKEGTWHIKGKPKIIKAKKSRINKLNELNKQKDD